MSTNTKLAAHAPSVLNPAEPSGGGNSPASEPGDPVLVRVRRRFEPQTIVAAAGEPLLLELRRDAASACAERFVFAAFGIDLQLPIGRPVRVEVPAAPPGEYPFGCDFGILRGRLVLR